MGGLSAIRYRCEYAVLVVLATCSTVRIVEWPLQTCKLPFPLGRLLSAEFWLNRRSIILVG